MTTTATGGEVSSPVRIVLACAASGQGGSAPDGVAEELESGLRAWGATLGLTFEIHGADMTREERVRWLVDRSVYVVALILEDSPGLDKELAWMLREARGTGTQTRYRIIVDRESLMAASLTRGPDPVGPEIRVVPHLASIPHEWWSGLIFDAVAEMLALDGLDDEFRTGVPAHAPAPVPAPVPPPPPAPVPTPAQPAEESAVPPVVDENVQFTVYRPRAIRPGIWYPMLAFAHLAERRPDAPADAPDPIEQVKALAQQSLGDQASAYASPTSDARGAIPREGELTFVPAMEGVEFNPPRHVFRWLEDVHEVDFRLRADAGLQGQVLRGEMTVFLGAFILADVPLVIELDQPAAQPSDGSTVVAPSPDLEPAQASPYRKIFPSYSHRDSAIVEQAERLGAALGDVYLRDRTALRSGEDWSARLLELIDEADVFQLFWSSNSMRSEYVRQEWEHANALARRHFIRPTYWEEPMPHSDDPLLPPESLQRLHFHCLAVAAPPSTEEPVVPPPSTPEPSMIICPQCGDANPRAAQFCARCGRYLAWDDTGSTPAQAPAPAAPPTPAQSHGPPTADAEDLWSQAPPPPAPQSGGYHRPRQRARGSHPTASMSSSGTAKTLVVISLVVAALILAFVVWSK